LPADLKESHGRRASGGWLRLDATPAADIGTRAADGSTWGQWQSRLHGAQSAWENYIVEMDRQRQREAVYKPPIRAIQAALKKLRDPAWWRGLLAEIGGLLPTIRGTGIVGWVLVVGLALLAAIVLAGVGWLLVRVVRRMVRRLLGRPAATASRTRIGVEFYRRLERLLAEHGLVRAPGQTPREFAVAAGNRLAQQSGREDLATLPVEVVDAFYHVRFGRQPLDNSRAQAVEHALEELAVSGTLPVPPRERHTECAGY
jgi:hypothetical protein